MHNTEISNLSPAISVVVCTYNRAGLLSELLRTLVIQTLSPDQYEIIIVDNNSTDATKDLCYSTIAENSGLHIRYVSEINQGLSHARNRGWNEAQGLYVGYLDDDCKVPPGWLQIAQSIIADQAPEVFGGPFYAYYNSPKPYWFKDEYGSHVQGSEPKLLPPGEFLDGGNFFINRNLLSKLGGFNTCLGMAGNKIGYGEETELQIRTRNQYPDSVIMYYPQLFVYHLVRREKMIIKSIIHQRFQSGRYSTHIFKDCFLSKKQILGQILGNMIFLVALLIAFPISHIFRDTTRYPFIQNFFYEKGARIFSILGFLYETILIIPLKSIQEKIS